MKPTSARHTFIHSYANCVILPFQTLIQGWISTLWCVSINQPQIMCKMFYDEKIYVFICIVICIEKIVFPQLIFHSLIILIPLMPLVWNGVDATGESIKWIVCFLAMLVEVFLKQSFMSWRALSNNILRSKIGPVAQKLFKFNKLLLFRTKKCHKRFYLRENYWQLI